MKFGGSSWIMALTRVFWMRPREGRIQQRLPPVSSASSPVRSPFLCFSFKLGKIESAVERRSDSGKAPQTNPNRPASPRQSSAEPKSQEELDCVAKLASMRSFDVYKNICEKFWKTKRLFCCDKCQTCGSQ